MYIQSQGAAPTPFSFIKSWPNWPFYPHPTTLPTPQKKRSAYGKREGVTQIVKCKLGRGCFRKSGHAPLGSSSPLHLEGFKSSNLEKEGINLHVSSVMGLCKIACNASLNMWAHKDWLLLYTRNFRRHCLWWQSWERGSSQTEGQPPFSTAILSDLSPWWLENTHRGIETPWSDG